MKYVIYVSILVILSELAHAEVCDFVYKLEKGDNFVYNLTMKGKTSNGLPSKEGMEWKECKPFQFSDDFYIEIKNVFEKEDGQKVYVLKFEVKSKKVGMDKESFTANMTSKGVFLFKNDEERKEFLRIETLWRSLYAGLVFPELPTEKIDEGNEYDSPDLITAFDRDYNLTFSGADVFLNKLKLVRIDKDSETFVLEGSKKSEVVTRRVKYKYDFKKSYIIDYSKSMVTLSRYERWKEDTSLNNQYLPVRSEQTWEVKLISINGKKVE